MEVQRARWEFRFGPFLALGGIVTLFAGEYLLDLYLDLF